MIANALVILIILLIINLVCIGLLYKSNRLLKKEVEDIKQWCDKIITDLIDQEKELDFKLNDLIKDIKDGAAAAKVTDLMNYEGKCPYHEEVYNLMKIEQEYMIYDVKNIKKEKEKILDDVMNNIKNIKEK